MLKKVKDNEHGEWLRYFVVLINKQTENEVLKTSIIFDCANEINKAHTSVKIISSDLFDLTSARLHLIETLGKENVGPIKGAAFKVDYIDSAPDFNKVCKVIQRQLFESDIPFASTTYNTKVDLGCDYPLDLLFRTEEDQKRALDIIESFVTKGFVKYDYWKVDEGMFAIGLYLPTEKEKEGV